MTVATIIKLFSRFWHLDIKPDKIIYNVYMYLHGNNVDIIKWDLHTVFKMIVVTLKVD